MQVNNGSNQTTIISFKKKKNCLMCNKLFEYTQPTTKYCSNACKCRAYSIRVKAGKRVKRIPKTAEEISMAHEFNEKDEILTAEQRIEELKNYVTYLHQQIQILFREHSEEKEELVNAHLQHIEKLHDYYKTEINSKVEKLQEQSLNPEDILKIANLANTLLSKK